MYKVYVIRQRRGGSEALPETRTTTSVFAAAEAAWRSLRTAEYDASHLLMLTHDRQKLIVYRYGSQPGDELWVPADAPLQQ